MRNVLLKTFLRAPLTRFRRHRAKTALRQLSLHQHPKLKAVGEALHETLIYALSNDERQWTGRIEQRRSQLLKSTAEIVVIDYGAGAPDANRTPEEMKRGVKSDAAVSKICKASKPQFWATVLFKLIRKLQPSSCIELGSCVGISASYLSAALKLNGKGQLQSLEGSPEIAEIATNTLTELTLDNGKIIAGPFHETLEQVLMAAQPIDFLFNDGHHDYDAVIHYFNESLPYLADDAIIVFDDISWSPGMRKAWAEVANNERVSAAIDLHTLGIVVVGKNVSTKEKFRIPL